MFLFCPNIIKLYNNGMGGEDIMDLKTAACRLGRKSKYRFYLRMFFDLIDVTHVYMKLGDRISLRKFEIVVANTLIGKDSSRKRYFPTSRPSTR